MKYNNFRRRGINIREANLILDLLKSYKIKIIHLKPHEYTEFKIKNKNFNYTQCAIVMEADSKLHIETKWYEPKYKATQYVCSLNDELEDPTSGQTAFRELQRNCFKAINAKNYHWSELDKAYSSETGKYVCSAGPIVDNNSKYEKQELYNVYEYDLNSAYSSIMLKGIPNVNKPYYNKIVGKNQVGFALDDKCTLIKPGNFAQIVFDIIELKPEQKKYIENIYRRIHEIVVVTAEDQKKKNHLKLMLNAAIGYYQRYNPFVRAYIVHKCNEVIKGLLDDDSILWNTDAIFSLKRRPELEIGSEIGQFKEIVIKRFAYKGNNYQINYEIPKYRGVPKKWFKKGWDILKDEIPTRCNMYIYDQNKQSIIKNKEYYEKIN